jgi:hypothetical protein
LTIATVRSALAGALGGITGLRATAYPIDQVNPPHAMELRRRLEYDVAQQTGVYDGVFVVRVFHSRTAEKAAQVFLDDLCEPTGALSVKATLEDSDVWTAAGVSYVNVKAAEEQELVIVGDVEYLAVDFELVVAF